jgi:Fe-S oxidoreductase
MEEVIATGAQVVVSACPLCESELGASGRKHKIKSLDLSEVVAQAIGLQL